MSQRKRLDRDGLEVYLFNLLMLYRPLLRISAGLIFLYAFATLNFYPFGSIVALAVASFLFLLTISHGLMLHMAKFGAWLGTLRERE
jgi:hypothetical protein